VLRYGAAMGELIEIEDEQHLTREEAAAMLRRLADSLSRHNEIQFQRHGLEVHVDVPDEVEFEIEIEVGTDSGSLEVEISW
jgi:amphi-Trp domain-containing protein